MELVGICAVAHHVMFDRLPLGGPPCCCRYCLPFEGNGGCWPTTRRWVVGFFCWWLEDDASRHGQIGGCLLDGMTDEGAAIGRILGGPIAALPPSGRPFAAGHKDGKNGFGWRVDVVGVRDKGDDCRTTLLLDLDRGRETLPLAVDLAVPLPERMPRWVGIAMKKMRRATSSSLLLLPKRTPVPETGYGRSGFGFLASLPVDCMA
ncbi:hypothetical protein ACLOJK_007069 [Asimina triloba]